MSAGSGLHSGSRPAPMPLEVSPQAATGSLVLILTEGEKRYLLRVKAGHRLHCHIGVVEHDSLVGQRFGTVGHSLTGKPFLLLEPDLHDLMQRVKRSTQIIYAKDAALITQRLGLRNGSTVLEAGTGSGSLTTALAWTVGPTGKVITVDGNGEVQSLAAQNLERFGLLAQVDLHHGYLERSDLHVQVDSAMLDMREPWRCLPKVRELLKPGGRLVCFLPTTNQVSELLSQMEESACVDIRVEELLLRQYKPVSDRLRPEDRMIAHTGFIVSAKMIEDPEDPQRWLSTNRLRYKSRQAAEARYREQARLREAPGTTEEKAGAD